MKSTAVNSTSVRSHGPKSCLIAFLAAALVVASCTTGEREGGMKTPYIVTGTITAMDGGAPLEGVTVLFLGEGAPGAVWTDWDGRYEQTGFSAGAVTVAPSGDYDFIYRDPGSGASMTAPVLIDIPEAAPNNTVQVDFTAVPPGASLDLLDPNGGEELACGGVFDIKWYVAKLGGKTVDMEYWNENIAQWVAIAGGVPCAEGVNSYAWTLPVEEISPCLVRITCVEFAAFTDESDVGFTISIAPTQPVVTIAASLPNASEAGPIAGEFTVSRTGDAAGDLVVGILVGGTAEGLGDDFSLTGSDGSTVTIPDGSWSAAITVTPLADADTDDETVIVAVVSGAGYDVGSPSNATVTIAEGNAPPAANDDSYTTDEGTQLNVAVPGVLANDSDPESDPLDAILVTDVSNGTLTLNSDGSFTYTPYAAFTGIDSFTYVADDGLAGSNVATVTITIGADYSGFWEMAAELDDGSYVWIAMMMEMIDTGTELTMHGGGGGDIVMAVSGGIAECWNYGDAENGMYLTCTLGADIDFTQDTWWRGVEIAEADPMSGRMSRTTMALDGNLTVNSGTYDGETVAIDQTPAFAFDSVYDDRITVIGTGATDEAQIRIEPASAVAEGSFTAVAGTPAGGQLRVEIEWYKAGDFYYEDVQGGSTINITTATATRIAGTFSLVYSAGTLTGSFDVPMKVNGTAPVADAFEGGAGDDTSGTATAVTLDAAAVSHTIHTVGAPGDVDWFSFVAVADTTYYIRTSNESVAWFGGLEVRLIGTDGSTEIMNNYGYGDLQPWLCTAGGTYYVEVSISGSLGFYDIEINTTMGLAADAWETGDDVYTGATTLTEGAVAQGPHTIDDTGDVDWFAVTVTSATATPVFETTSAYPPLIEIYEPDGTTFIMSDSGTLSSGGPAPTVDTYFLKVSGAETWYYIVWRDYEPDADEPNESAVAAGTITVDAAAQSRTLHTDADEDWLSFSATATTVYYIEVPTSTLDQISIALYGTDGTTLLLESQGGGMMGSVQIAWTCPGNGTYFVKVVQPWGAVGGYDVEVRTTP